MFKDIKGYEGKYQINEYGVVKSKSRQKGAVFCKERILKPDIVEGYKRYTLCKNDETKRQFAHRLVYQTFVGEIKEGLYIHHIDENKLNNHISNLMPATPRENNHYSRVTNGYKLFEKDVKSIRKRNLSVKEIVEEYNISPRHALRIIKRERWG